MTTCTAELRVHKILEANKRPLIEIRAVLVGEEPDPIVGVRWHWELVDMEQE